MFQLAARLQEEILAQLALAQGDEGVLRLSGREVRFYRGWDAQARATRALYTLAPRELTIVPPVEIAPGTWCLIL